MATTGLWRQSIWLVVVAMMAAAVATNAQDDPAKVVQSQESDSAALAGVWLGSGDARVRAWGAYLAVRDRRRQLLPQLTALAEGYVPRTGPFIGAARDEHNAMLGVLDALIQLNGSLSLDQAAALYAEFPTQSLIFLSHGQPAADTVLLDLFQKEDQQFGAWLAEGNLLMNRRPLGFAATVLRGYTVHANVQVADVGAVPALGGGYGGSCPSGAGGPQAGWPPVGSYYISTRGTLMVSGIVPSFYWRTVGGPDPNGPGNELACEFFGWKRDALREHFLAQLVGESVDNPSVRSGVTVTIVWKTDTQYQSDLRAFIHQEQTLMASLSDKLTAHGLLTAEEQMTARPTLALTVSDARSSRSSNLPPVGDLDSNVSIVSQPDQP